MIYDRFLAVAAAAYDKLCWIEQTLVHHRRTALAATFTPPLDYQHNLFAYAKTVFRTFFYYRELRFDMQKHFLYVFQLLQSLPNEGSVKADAQKLAFLHAQRGVVPYLKLTWLCVKLRKKIFFVEEKNPILALLRAVYFPISCSDYFRYLAKSYKR
jgi:hypothetical protein